MKKVLQHVNTLLLAMGSVSSAFAIALGEMTLQSHLNEPFQAEIELIDIGREPLAGIKASLASVNEYEQFGLDASYALSDIVFQVDKNQSGKPIIKLRSVKKITEPYLQIFVDLVWATGQVDRLYTVLLDPPDYQLAKKDTVALSVSGTQQRIARVRPQLTTRQAQAAAYGPTQPNETIWQVAQHYKTADTILQQVMLAILGTNPGAFHEGNLNGLKPGVTLNIPSAEVISTVPAGLAKQEVSAQDSAWQAKRAIQHVLQPPYIEGEASHSYYPSQILSITAAQQASYLVKVPVFSKPVGLESLRATTLLPKLSSMMSAASAETETQANQAQQKHQVAMDVASIAIESVRESNAILNEQLRLLQAENKRMQQQLAERDMALMKLKKQIQVLSKRQGVIGQVASEPANIAEHGLPIGLWILLASTVAGIYWRFWLRRRPSRSQPNEVPDSSETETPVPTSTDSFALPNAAMERSAASAVPPLLKEDVLDNDQQVTQDTNDFLGGQEVSLVQEVSSAVMAESQEQFTVPLSSPLETQPPIALDMVDEPLIKAPAVEDNGIEYEIVSLSPEVLDEPLPAVEAKEQAEVGIAFEETPAPDVMQAPPLGSAQASENHQAIETLLALATTYISMGDVESARQSLEEVLQQGNAQQQAEAQKLIQQL